MKKYSTEDFVILTITTKDKTIFDKENIEIIKMITEDLREMKMFLQLI